MDEEARLEAVRIEAAQKRKATLARHEEDLLYQVGYRCLVGEEPLASVARELGIARSYATTLLARVSDSTHAAIIPKQVFFRTAGNLEATVRGKLKKRYGLKHIRIVPTPPDDRAVDSPQYRAEVRKNLGWAAAELTAELVSRKKTARVAVSGGRTLTHFAQTFRPPNGTALILQPLLLVSRWGKVSYLDPSVVLQLAFSENEPARLKGDRDQLTVLCVEAPPAVITKLKEDEWAEYPEIASIFRPGAKQPDVVLTTIGRRRYLKPVGSVPHRDTGTIVQRATESAHFLRIRDKIATNPRLLLEPIPLGEYARANREMFRAGVVGDVCNHMIGIDGRAAAPPESMDMRTWPLETTTLAPSLTTLKEWTEQGTVNVAISGGRSSVHAFRAALLGGYFNAAVIDLALGLQLLTQEERQGVYGFIPDEPQPVEVEESSARS